MLCLISSLLSSCSKEPITSIDPALQRYVGDFLEVAKQKHVEVSFKNLIIEFGDLEKNTYGTCSRSVEEDALKTITIDRSRFEGLSDPLRENLIFHELGHCVLSRNHNNSTLLNGEPTSIMNAHLLSETVYSKNSNHYLEELFNQ